MQRHDLQEQEKGCCPRERRTVVVGAGSGKGAGIRLPAAVATELQFSRDNVVPFNPGGVASSREWIQINRAEAAEYEKDLALFQASIDFVKGGR